MASEISQLETVDHVIDALGGVSSVCELIGARKKRSWQRVDNWRLRGRFPSDTYVVLTDALKARQFSAPARLWGMLDPPAPDESDCREAAE